MTTSTDMTLALDSIDVPDNVRALNTDHVDALAASIRLRGVITPINVRPDPERKGRYVLVAGHHRHAAVRKLGLTEIPATIREHTDTSADTAAENVLRYNLTPLGEARAVQAMLDEGYTADGAATALGWSVRKVNARAKILGLPDSAQQLLDDGRLPVRAVDLLLTVDATSHVVCEALIAPVAADEVSGDQLLANPLWLLGHSQRNGQLKTFIATMDHVDHDAPAALRLGKKAEQALTRAETLHRKLNQFAYGPPTIDFTDVHVDQARAAGVLLELPGGHRPVSLIVDKPLYRELCKQAIHQFVDELQQRVDARGQERASDRAAARPRSPREAADIEHRAALRQLTATAHNVNLDLGRALLDQLATVDPASMDVARFFAYGLLGSESSYTNDHTATIIAANGIRLILDEHRTTVTPTLKSGHPGKTKVTYANVEQASKWLWKFVDAAKTPGELYGRALVVFAAQHHAHQIALPLSQRRPTVLPRSHSDHARKALERLTKRVLPASHKQLTRAIATAARDHHDAIARAAVADRGRVEEPAEADVDEDAQVDDDEQPAA